MYASEVFNSSKLYQALRRGIPDLTSGDALRSILEARAAMEAAVRAWFEEEGFVEVTTPILVDHPNLDPNIRPIPVESAGPSGDRRRRWLHTSPELSMKKLLGRGSGSIYQISSVFRDGEGSSLHRTEFSMLEWYRVEADYEDAIRDTIRVMRKACDAVADSCQLNFGGRIYDLDAQWEEITMAEAFERHAGVEALTRDGLTEALQELGYTVEADSVIDDLFFHVYVESVEPFLGIERPTIIRDYPSFLGTMAKPREDAPDVLERFEVYIAGLELANGYTEFTDSFELERRMEKVMVDLASDGVKGITIDDVFLQAMADMPPCAGVSVGMDRLAMLALDAPDISQVVFPYEEHTT